MKILTENINKVVTGLCVLTLVSLGINSYLFYKVSQLKDAPDQNIIVPSANVDDTESKISALERDITILDNSLEAERMNRVWEDKVNKSSLEILRMDLDLYPKAPDVIEDGNIFRLNPGQQANLIMPCGGGPDFDMYEDSLKRKTAVILHSITKTEDGYDIQITFGKERQSYHYNPNYSDEIIGISGSHAILQVGDTKNGSGMVLEIMRAEEGKLFVRGVRRSC
jgi:hypothetical protein